MNININVLKEMLSINPNSLSIVTEQNKSFKIQQLLCFLGVRVISSFVAFHQNHSKVVDQKFLFGTLNVGLRHKEAVLKKICPEKKITANSTFEYSKDEIDCEITNLYKTQFIKSPDYYF